MKYTFFSMRCGTGKVGTLLLSLLLLSGCGLKDIQTQTSLMDNTGVIRGTIRCESQQEGPIIVLRFRVEEGLFALERRVTASEDGDFAFDVIRGSYSIFAFIDVNGDGRFQAVEHGNYFGTPTAVAVQDNEVIRLQPIVIAGPVPTPDKEIQLTDRSIAAWNNIGQVVTLEDPRFTPEMYTKGLWMPLEFLESAEGGLFFLEAYDKRKTPVLFIHGVVNGPTLWREVVAELDRNHFQPWLFYYPSGIRLELTADYLTEAVLQLQETFRFEKYCVVAHSMGGLVARSFVKKYVERAPQKANSPQLVMTINSPMNGMSAAAYGLQHSPVIVPSWRDVVPESDFLRELHAWKWPEEIPYHLVVSYVNGKSGDGVVPLQSQAAPKLQDESSRMYIFNAEHTEIITSSDFHALLNRVLAATGRK